MCKGKIVNVIELLFPGYVFVNIEGCEYLIVSTLSTRGVRQLLRFGIAPIEIRQNLIDDLRHRYGDLNQNCNGLEDSRQTVFNEGQVVEIILGPFKDYQAIFKQFDSEQRAIILLNLLCQQQELLVE
jgi:transcriptional antiterminator RfaH